MGSTQLNRNDIVEQCIKVVQYFDTSIAFHFSFNQPLQVIGVRDNQFLVLQLVFSQGRYQTTNFTVGDDNSSIIAELKLFQVLIEQNLDFIIRSWVDYFLFNKQPSTEVIEKRLSING